MYNPESSRHIHDKILKTIGVERIRFHDLRGPFATLSLKNGVDVKPLSSFWSTILSASPSPFTPTSPVK